MEKKKAPTDLEVRAVLAENVIRLRKKLELSQEKLAAQAGFHRTYLSQVELSRRNMSLESLVRLAAELGVEPYELLKPQLGTMQAG